MKIVRAVCPHDCPDTCAMLVEVDDNVRAVRVKGDPANPYTHGGLCVKVAHYEKRTYHRDRLLYPMKRSGKKGDGDEHSEELRRASEIGFQHRCPCWQNPNRIAAYSGHSYRSTDESQT